MKSLKNTNKTIKIGLLGGSFNPPHKGHIHISELAYKTFGLHKIWWVVSPQNPLKSGGSGVESFKNRVMDAKKFTSKNRFIEVKSIERDINPRGKVYYTYNFFKKLLKKYPKYQFYFIIGADNLVSFHKWYRWQGLLNLVNFIAINRGEEKYKALASKAYKTGKVQFLNAKKINISSSELRILKKRAS